MQDETVQAVVKIARGDSVVIQAIRTEALAIIISFQEGMIDQCLAEDMLDSLEQRGYKPQKIMT